MSDKRQLTTAERAVFHIYRRVQSDANFAWLMIGTESLALCCQAIAERQGRDEENVLDEIFAKAASRSETPEVVRLRKCVSELERELDDVRNGLSNDRRRGRVDAVDVEDYAAKDRRALARIEELLRLAECGCDVLTIDDLREALIGPATRPISSVR